MAAAGAVVGLPVGVAKEDVAQAGEEGECFVVGGVGMALLDGCQQVFGAGAARLGGALGQERLSQPGQVWRELHFEALFPVVEIVVGARLDELIHCLVDQILRRRGGAALMRLRRC
jgi:hypothetical protein